MTENNPIDTTPENDTATTTEQTASDTTASAWLIPGKLYDVLKWLAALVIPALAVFVSTVGPVWGWPRVDAIVTTLNALATFSGVVIGVSAIKQRYDLAA